MLEGRNSYIGVLPFQTSGAKFREKETSACSPAEGGLQCTCSSWERLLPVGCLCRACSAHTGPFEGFLSWGLGTLDKPA